MSETLQTATEAKVQDDSTEQPVEAALPEALPIEQGGPWWPDFFRTWWLIVKSPSKAFSAPMRGKTAHTWKYLLSLYAIFYAAVFLDSLISLVFGLLFSSEITGPAAMLLSASLGGGFLITFLGIVSVALAAGFLLSGVLINFLLGLFGSPAPLPITFRALSYGLSPLLLFFPLYLISQVIRPIDVIVLNRFFFFMNMTLHVLFMIAMAYIPATALALTHGCGRIKAVIALLCPLLLIATALFYFKWPGA